jgi:hypothetical protein
MEKLLCNKFNSREECIEAVVSTCSDENFKSSIKNSKKGYEINFRRELAEKVQRKKTPGVGKAKMRQDQQDKFIGTHIFIYSKQSSQISEHH